MARESVTNLDNNFNSLSIDIISVEFFFCLVHNFSTAKTDFATTAAHSIVSIDVANFTSPSHDIFQLRPTKMKSKIGSGIDGLCRSGIHGPKAGQGPLELMEKLTRNGWKDFQ